MSNTLTSNLKDSCINQNEEYSSLEDIRVSVKQAAKELHMSQLTLQCLMQNGRLPIGYAIKRDGKSRYGYYIYRGLLDAEKKRIGID